MTTVDDPRTSASDLRSKEPVRFADVNGAVKTPPGAHFAKFDQLREQGPIHWGDASGNPYWLVSDADLIRDAFQDPATYSNSAATPDQPNPSYLWIPEMLDAPLHTKWRQLTGPLFSPGAVEKLKPQVHARFMEILDDVAPRGECDFVADVALRFPNTIFLELIGLPISDAALFQEWEFAILHTGAMGGDEAVRAMNEVMQYFAGVVAERRKSPQHDIISQAITWTIDGEKISDEDLLAFCLLMFMAGLDTVAAQLSYSVLHLATNPDDLDRLAREPELMPSAIEEFLRFYSFVTPGRKVMRDTELGGCPIKQGEMVYLPLVSANRDPKEFPDADKVILDRENNRHMAFGAGPHRCLGSHLARQELLVGMTEWHKRIPKYRLNPDVPITEHGGQIGLDNVPIIWDV
jgi:cytochrome P450